MKIAFSQIDKARAKVILEKFGLSTDGKKIDLQKRIKAHVGKDEALRQQVVDSLNQAAEASAAKGEAAEAARSAAATAERVVLKGARLDAELSIKALQEELSKATRKKKKFSKSTKSPTKKKAKGKEPRVEVEEMRADEIQSLVNFISRHRPGIVIPERLTENQLWKMVEDVRTELNLELSPERVRDPSEPGPSKPPEEPQAQAQHKPREELTAPEVDTLVQRQGHTRQQLDDQTGAIGEGARIYGRYTPAMMYHHQMRKQLAQWNRHNLYYPYQNTAREHGKKFLMLNRVAHYD